MTYGERVYEFFSEYLDFSGEWGKSVETKEDMKECCELLLSGHVFSSYEEIRKEALKKANVILPYDLKGGNNEL